ncbi:MAG: hypothetical protein N3D20_01890 [Candidatus Pacearchaeota archaeon]|nr:hypothetical protein [Candidatus Pacearchaeota archaeon]
MKGIDFIWNKYIFENHKIKTRTKEPKFHVILWATSNKAKLFMNRIIRKEILIMLRKKNEENRNIRLFILFEKFSGVVRFRINSKR